MINKFSHQSFPFRPKRIRFRDKQALFRTPGKLRGAIKIQSADENSSTLPPRHLLLTNQRSSMEEERAVLIGVVTSWGVVLFAQGYCISQACMAACYEAQRPLKFPFLETFQRLHEETKLFRL